MDPKTVLDRQRGIIKGQITKLQNVLKSENPPEGPALSLKCSATETLKSKLEELRKEACQTISDEDYEEYDAFLNKMEEDLEDLETVFVNKMERRWRHFGYFVLLISSTVMCHVRPDFPSAVAPELQELRQRWGAADIIRDLEHIKQDAQKIVKLQDSGQISTNEALFYFLRMHDFDDNTYLDGHELLAAMSHALEHSADGHPMSLEEKEAIVDSFFAYDDNNDGFVSYPELRKHLSSDLSNDVPPVQDIPNQY